VRTLQELEIKRGHFKNVEGDKLNELMVKYFKTVKKDGEKISANFGAMKPIQVWIKGKNILCVEIITDKGADESVAMDTIRAKNGFLEEATGFTSGERAKRLQKKAKEGSL
jgi:hypothetical protein